MSDRNNKVELNVPGKWYVDVDCIDCDLCRTTAPDNFEAAEGEGYSYVHKQPETPEQEALCRQALEECPVESIGDDG